jgi:hypothetical protein
MSRILLYRGSELLDINNNRKKSSTLNDDDLVYFADHYDDETYNSLKHRYGTPTRMLFDVECTIEPQEFKAIYIPALSMGMLNWINLFNKSNLLFPESVTTEHCCNFSMNRGHYDRHIFLKLLEEVFPNLDFVYSWHGRLRNHDLTYLLEELRSINSIKITEELRSKLLSPIRLSSCWFNNSNDESTFTGHSMTHGEFNENWTSAHRDLCASSAVCLLTESFSNHQKNYTFTEKTLYAILGLNFPIWVGNYGQADVAKSMGIDTFEDIIDHSYQYKKTIFERCYFAIEQNLEILTSLEYAKHLRNNNLKRLISNRDYMLNGGFTHWVKQEVLRYDLQDLIV